MCLQLYSTYPLSQALQNEITCPYCLEKAEEDNPEEWVAHSNGGDLHPVHRKCNAIWMESYTNCMTCRVEVDISSLEKMGKFLDNNMRSIARVVGWGGVGLAVEAKLGVITALILTMCLNVTLSLPSIIDKRSEAEIIIEPTLLAGYILEYLTSRYQSRELNIFKVLKVAASDKVFDIFLKSLSSILFRGHIIYVAIVAGKKLELAIQGIAHSIFSAVSQEERLGHV